MQHNQMLRIPDPTGQLPVSTVSQTRNLLQALIWARMRMAGLVPPTSHYCDEEQYMSMNTLDEPALQEFNGFDLIVLNAPRRYGKTTQAPYVGIELAEMWRREVPVDKNECSMHPNSSSKFIVIVDSPNAAISLHAHYKKIYPNLRIEVALDDAGMNKDDFVGTQGQYNKKPRSDEAKLSDLPHGYIVSPQVGAQMCRIGYIGTVFVDNADSCKETVNVVQLLSIAAEGIYDHNGGVAFDASSLRRIGKVVLFCTSTGGRGGAMAEIVKSFATANQLSALIAYNKNGHRRGQVNVLSSCIYDCTKMHLCNGLRQNPEWNVCEATKGIASEIGNAVHYLQNYNALIRWESDGATQPMEPNVRNNKLELMKTYEAASVEASTRVTGREDGRFPSMLLICAALEQATSLASKAVTSHQSYMCISNGGFVCTHDRQVYNNNPKAMMWTVERLSIENKYDAGVNEASTVNLNVANGANWKYKGIFNNNVYTGKLVVATLETATMLDIPNLAFVVCTADVTRYQQFTLNGLSSPYDRYCDKWDIEEMRSRVNAKGFFIVGNTDEQVARCLEDDQRMAGNMQDRYTLMDYLDLKIVSEGLETFDISTQGTFLRVHTPVIPAAQPHTQKKAFMREACTIMGLMKTRTDGTVVPNLDTVSLMRAFPFLPIEFGKFVLMGVKLGVAKQAIVIAALYLTGDRLCQQAANAGGGVTYQDPLVDLFNYVVSTFLRSDPNRLGNMPMPTSEWISMAEMWTNYLFCTNWKVSTLDRPRSVFVDCNRDSCLTRHLFQRQRDCNFWTAEKWSSSREWRNRPPAYFPSMGNGLTHFKDLYKTIVKDEGREAFEQNVKRVCNALYAHGIVDNPDAFKSHSHNRFNLSAATSMLSTDGMHLLSALLAMSMPYVAGHDGRTQIAAGQSGEGSYYPDTWKVYDSVTQGNVHVTGFSKCARDYPYCIYSPSHSCPMKTRGKKFHTSIMPFTEAQVFIFANSEAQLEQQRMDEMVLRLQTCGKPDSKPLEMRFGFGDERMKIIKARQYIGTVLHNCVVNNSPNVNDDTRGFIIEAWANTSL